MPPGIGYNPTQYGSTGAGPQTIEQWISDMALSYTYAYANGEGGEGSRFTSGLFANEVWAGMGLNVLPPRPDPNRDPSDPIDPMIFQNMSLFFKELANRPDLAQANGLNIPDLPRGGAATDPQGRDHLYGAAQNEADRRNQIDLANINNQGANDRQAAADAAAKDRLQLETAHEAAMQGAQQAWASGESEKARQFEAAAAQLQRAWESGENQADRDFTGAQNEAGRALQMALATMQEAGMDRRQLADLQSRLEIVKTQEAGASERQRTQIEFETAEGERARVHEAAIVNLQEAGMDRRQAEELASRLSITELQEAGQNARNAARIAADKEIATLQDATDRYGIETQAGVQREDIAARERIATGDRESRELIAGEDRAESARQFDFGLAEDRRQFNATMLFELFDRGIQLAKNPVDWIAHQYYMANLSVPLTALAASSSAALLGAIPPSGPSAAGPMTGGPGAMDGDTQLAQAAGTEARFVPLAEAIQMNPGDMSNPVIAGLVAQQTGTQIDSEMGLQNVQRMLSEQQMNLGRAGEIADNPVLRQAMEIARQNFVGSPPQAPGQQPGTQPGLPPLEGAHAAGQQPQQMPPPSNSSLAEGGGGIFTGADQTQAQTPNPQAELYRQLAETLGISPEDAQRLLPSHLLSGAYSQEAIANSPVMQALNTGAKSMSQFRTADQSGEKFGTIGALGTPVNFRSGQDVNANLLMGNPSQVDQIRGVVEGTGQDWRDFQRQSFKAAPVSQYEIGAFGRRR